MFHWPVLSAIVGIGTNLFFIALVCTLSYLHFAVEEENTDVNFSYEKGEAEDEKDPKRINDCKSLLNILILHDLICYRKIIKNNSLK